MALLRLGAIGALLSSVAVMTFACRPATPPRSQQAASSPAERPSTSTGLPMPLGLDEAAMDTTVAPCDDFYRFSCGKWVDHAQIRADLPLADRSFVALYLAEQDDAKEIFEGAAAGHGSRLLGDFYASCADEGKLEASLAPLRAELAAVDAVLEAAALSAFVGQLHARGVSAFFAYGVTSDYERAETMIAEIDQGGMALPAREFYTSDDDQDGRRP